MKLVVGLGNPGIKYEETRHNIGFMLIDALSKFYNFPSFKTKFNSLFSSTEINNIKVILQKPQTYMNLSGNAVLALSKFYNIHPNDIIVFQDDLDLSFLQLRYKTKSGHGGHNGIRDIQNILGNEIHKIKIGIGRPSHNSAVSDYVLDKFNNMEYNQLEDLLDIVSKQFPLLLTNEYCEFVKSVSINDNK